MLWNYRGYHHKTGGEIVSMFFLWVYKICKYCVKSYHYANFTVDVFHITKIGKGLVK